MLKWGKLHWGGVTVGAQGLRISSFLLPVGEAHDTAARSPGAAPTPPPTGPQAPPSSTCLSCWSPGSVTLSQGLSWVTLLPGTQGLT